jgi:VIT1/CCC1 family predicted Fe2+/Mn2+ transporter
MSNLAMWSALVGTLLPLLVAFVNRSTWSSGAKAVVAVISSAIAGTVTAWLNGELSGRDVVTAILIVATATVASYHGLWKPTTIAPAIEEATSPEPRRYATR